MSGGALDYIHFKLDNAVEDLQRVISDPAAHLPEEHREDVLHEIEKMIAESNALRKRLRAIDYLICGDYSSDSFFEEIGVEPKDVRMQRILRSILPIDRVSVPPQEWEQIIKTVSLLQPVSVSHGTHCSDRVYIIDDHQVTITECADEIVSVTKKRIEQ